MCKGRWPIPNKSEESRSQQKKIERVTTGEIGGTLVNDKTGSRGSRRGSVSVGDSSGKGLTESRLRLHFGWNNVPLLMLASRSMSTRLVCCTEQGA